MHRKENNANNLHIDIEKEFKQKLNAIDTTYTNKLISNIKINVLDDGYRLDNFNINTTSLVQPLTCAAKVPTNKMRHINVPKYQEYQYNISPFNEYIPFVSKDSKRPYGELHFRKKTLTSIEDFPRIDIDALDNKINMKKW